MSELVIELSVEKGNDGRWYRKGLNMRGEEVWEICEEVNCDYGDDWIDEIINSVNERNV